jgi:outer membrane protein assembly factor BamA
MHSRYTSIVESFLLPAVDVLVPASSDLYLIANDLSLTLRHDAIVPSRTSEINPVGRKVKLRLGVEFNKFNGDGQYTINSDGGLAPVYKQIDFYRVELLWKEYLPFVFNNHTLSFLFRGGSILGPSVDNFFDFYAGGLPGMKGYPFYSLGGNEFAIAGLAYRFPLLSDIDLRFFNFYFNKLYGSLFVDIGDAWTGDVPAFKEFKTDAGAELRLESFSFYAFPTRIFFNAAYGFDTFRQYISSRNATVTYGQEWNFYFGILFDFDLDF